MCKGGKEDRELQGKLEARELLQATKTDDRIKALATHINDKYEVITERMEEIEVRLQKEAKKRKRKKKP